jgi:hypothetical protein
MTEKWTAPNSNLKDIRAPRAATPNVRVTSEATPVSTNAPVYNAEATIDMMRYDLNTFSAIVFPEGHLCDFSELHCNIWQQMIEAVMKGEDVTKHAVGLPRGHAKTQLLKFLIVYTILFSPKAFILVVCNAATLAQNLLADVCGMLSSDNVVALFGDWRNDVAVDKQELKKFYFRGKNVILKPMGSGSAVRGVNISNKRPELIICDDMQSLEEARSPEVSKNILQWFLGTLLKARSPHMCSIFYVGNMYPDIEIGERGSGIYACILRNLQLNSEWLSWIVGAILEDGTALWQEVISIDSLLSDLAQDTALGQEEIFYAEVLNDPRASASRYLDPSKIPDYPYHPTDLVLGKFLLIDPSLGKKKSDDQIVGLFYVYDEKGPVLHEIRHLQLSAPELVKTVLLWALEESIPLILAEDVAYQATLIQWFAYYIDQLNIEGVEVAGINPKGVQKVTRILLMFKAWMAGSFMCSPAVKPLVLAQAQMFVPTNANNVDDILDVAGYGERAYLEYSSSYIVDIDLMPESAYISESSKTPNPNGKDINEFLAPSTDFL